MKLLSRYYDFIILLVSVTCVCWNLNEVSARTAREAPRPPNLQQLKKTYASKKNPREAWRALGDIVRYYATQPLTSEQWALVRKDSEELLKISDNYTGDWAYGDAYHHAHIALGRLSLHENKIFDAIQNLQLAGRTIPSPTLRNFGPNMLLAKELLQRKQKQAVLDYLEACRKIWTSQLGEEKIPQWKNAIQQGRIPNFGANLVF